MLTNRLGPLVLALAASLATPSLAQTACPNNPNAIGIARTVDWYLANAAWVQRVLDGSYRMERLGAA